MTLNASKEKFTRVCMEVDLIKPLKARYKLRGTMWKLRYEGLHDLRFERGRYNHRSSSCPQFAIVNVEEGTKKC